MWNKVTCNPTYSDFLKHKEAKRYYRSINSIRPLVDTSRPKPVEHLKSRSKKNQLSDDRQKEIDHKNKVLMEKMINIEQRANGINKKAVSKKSLNKETRSKNNLRINQENLKFLDRLQSAQPVICKQKWEVDERHWINIRENIRKVPRRSSRPNSSRDVQNFELIQKILKRRQTRPTTALSHDFSN